MQPSLMMLHHKETMEMIMILDGPIDFLFCFIENRPKKHFVHHFVQRFHELSRKILDKFL